MINFNVIINKIIISDKKIKIRNFNFVLLNSLAIIEINIKTILKLPAKYLN